MPARRTPAAEPAAISRRPPRLRRLGGAEAGDVALAEALGEPVAVGLDGMGQPLELGGGDRARVVEGADQVGEGLLVLAVLAVATVLLVEPVEGRPGPFGDRVVGRQRGGRGQAVPLLARQPAADRVAAR